MMTIQKPKRIWQKKKDYMRKKTIRGLRRKGKRILQSFDDGKDMSYQDWKTKAAKYKNLKIDEDNTFDYEGWYNSNPENAYRFLNDDPRAHFDDTYKTVYHPTFSDLSIYSGKIDPKFNPKGLKGGHWVNDHKYTSPKETPISMDDRINYIIDGEDNGIQLRTFDNKPLWMDDGTRYEGQLPQVIVKPKKYKRGKDCFDMGTDNKPYLYYGTPEQLANPNTIWEYPEAKDGAVITPKGNYADTQQYIAATHGSAYDPNAPFEMFNDLVFNSAPALLDTAYQGATGQYGEQGAKMPVQNALGKIYQYTAPSRYLGSAKTLLPGYTFQLPWSDDNPGLIGNPNLDGIFDMLVLHGVGNSQHMQNVPSVVKSGINTGIRKLAEKASTIKSPVGQYIRYPIGKLLYGLDARFPDLIRRTFEPLGKSSTFSKNRVITPIVNRFMFKDMRKSEPITNMTTDHPVIPNNGGDWTGSDIHIIPGKTLLGKNVISTRPQDTFTYGDVIEVPNKDIKTISGRNSKNSKYRQIQKDVESDYKYKTGVDNTDLNLYEKWLQEEFDKLYKRPSKKDYHFMDYVLQPEYKSAVMRYTDDVKKIKRQDILNNYTNGDVRPRITENTFENILYDMAPTIDYQFRDKMGIGLKSEIYHNSGKDIHIKKANRGKFTEAANEHNMGVQEFARQVLSAPKGKYSSTLRKRANFARNFAH